MTPTSQQDDYYAKVQNTAQSGHDDKKPLKLKLKAVVKKPLEEQKEEVSAPPVEKPKARLVEREHASSGLLKTVMKNGGEQTDTRPRNQDARPSFPKISFAKADKIKILENRPVMQIPDEVPKRRTESTSSSPSSQARLRDDSKPMFQRNIGFMTPSKDGTAKK